MCVLKGGTVSDACLSPQRQVRFSCCFLTGMRKQCHSDGISSSCTDTQNAVLNPKLLAAHTCPTCKHCLPNKSPTHPTSLSSYTVQGYRRFMSALWASEVIFPEEGHDIKSSRVEITAGLIKTEEQMSI